MSVEDKVVMFTTKAYHLKSYTILEVHIRRRMGNHLLLLFVEYVGIVLLLLELKGIVSDSKNIILWHESEDINKKSLFPKFQLIPILLFQIMHDYVGFNAPIDYCVE